MRSNWSGEDAVKNAQRQAAQAEARRRARLDDANALANGSKVTLAEARKLSRR